MIAWWWAAGIGVVAFLAGAAAAGYILGYPEPPRAGGV